MPFRRRWLKAGLLASTGALGIGGCAPFDYAQPDAPAAVERPLQLTPRPRLALALGSGGPRGYAHVGVLRVLEEAGIIPDLVAGSSVGAFIGAFWAGGLDAARLDALSFSGGPLSVFDPTPFADRGWIRGQRLQDYVNDGLGGRHLEDLPRRLVVVATRRSDKRAAWFITGNTGVAVRASSAMPGIVSPVGIRGVEYEDGDESSPVPVFAARAAGAEFVIAVDVSARPDTIPADLPVHRRERDRRRRERIEPEVREADFLIHPALDYWAGPRHSYFIEARRRGEACARELLPALQARLQARFGHPTGTLSG